MSSSQPDSYPPNLSPEQEEYLLSTLKDWSIAHGLAVRPPPSFVAKEIDPAGVLAATAPVTLFPSLFPRSCFQEGIAIQGGYNELYSAIAADEAWLGEIVEKLAETDDFTAKLWQIHQDVKREGYANDVCLGLFRSDYMLHVDPSSQRAKPQLKQVEFNTIASSFGGLSAKVSGLHEHLRKATAYPPFTAPIVTWQSLPAPQAIRSLTEGLARAHKEYGASHTGHESCILFVVQDQERNVFDQRHLEYELGNHWAARVFRLPFDKILDLTSVVGDKRALIYRPPHSSPSVEYEVSTVYLRAGYSPADYPTQRHWDARRHLERSAAIMCPSLLTHLAGCKKVQQVLATPGSQHLERFLASSSDSIASRIRSTFVRMYPLDDTSEAGKEGRRLATDESSAKRFVLKPQREGGGNNIYRSAIVPFLRDEVPSNHWPAYILMEMIEPPPARNFILRNGVVEKGGVVCELGVYGVCIWRNKRDESGVIGRDIVLNSDAGYLLRTKGDQSEEGGVAAGFGAVDSCCLVDDSNF